MTFKNRKRFSYDKNMLYATIDEQYAKFFEIRKSDAKNLLNEDCSFSENTLIHGTAFDYKKLRSIRKTGILAGDFVGIEDEFDETDFCADFFRLDREMSLFEFFREMNGAHEWTGSYYKPITPMGAERTPHKEYINVSNMRLPFLDTPDSKNNIAFIIDGKSAELNELQKYDYYRDKYSIMREVVSPKNTECFYAPQMSAILLGVPYNLISAIVVGTGIEKDYNKMRFIQHLCTNLPIFSSSGEILFIPGYRRKNYNEYEISRQFNKELKHFAKTACFENIPQSLFAKRALKYKSLLNPSTYNEREL